MKKNKTATKPSTPIVPRMVNATVFPVFGGGGGGKYAWLTRGLTSCSGGKDVGMTIRSDAGDDANISAAGSDVRGLRRIIVSSPRSSSGVSRFSLGSAAKLGCSSSTSGVPSFVQKRIISSS